MRFVVFPGQRRDGIVRTGAHDERERSGLRGTRRVHGPERKPTGGTGNGVPTSLASNVSGGGRADPVDGGLLLYEAHSRVGIRRGGHGGHSAQGRHRSLVVYSLPQADILGAHC